MKHLACPQCGTTNRVADERLQDRPVCGRCGAELMAARPVPLADAVFEKFIAGTELPVLVDFWAEWCGPCRMIAPALEEISTEMSGSVKIAKLNIDDNQETPAKFGIRGIPTLMLFKNGNVEATKVGALSKSQLTAFIDSNL